MKKSPIHLSLFAGLLLLFSAVSLAQNIRVDSTLVRLENTVLGAENDSLKIDALIRLGRYQMSRDFNKVDGYLIEVFELFERNPQLKPSSDYARAHQQLGILNRKRGNYAEALKNYFITKQNFEKVGEFAAVGATYHNMAIVYRFQKDYDKSIEYFRKAKKIKQKAFESGDRKSPGLQTTYSMMALSFLAKKEIDSAIYYADASQKLSLELEDEIGFYNSNVVKADILNYRKDYEAEEQLLSKNIAFAKRINKQEGIVSNYLALANVHYIQKENKVALTFIDSAMALSKVNKLNRKMAAAYNLQSKIYQTMGRFEEALKAYQSNTKILDTLFDLDKVKELQGMELTSQFQQLRLADSLSYDKEKAMLTADIEKRKATKWRNYTIIGVLLILIIILYLFNKKRLQLEHAEKELLNKELEESERKIETKESEISSLMVESIQQIKSKKKIKENLKKIKNESKADINLNSLIAELNAENLEDEKILRIRENLKSQNFEFHRRLKARFPNLTNTDLEICTFIKMGLGRNEIAKLRNTSSEAVKKSRYRLRKKLEIDNNFDLHTFLNSI